MFDDAKEELERLEAELLMEEEKPEESSEEDRLDALLEEFLDEPQETDRDDGNIVYHNYSNQYGNTLRNYANGYRAYNTDTADRNLDEYSDEVDAPEKEKGLGGLIAIALALMLGILGVLAWWLVHFL